MENRINFSRAATRNLAAGFIAFLKRYGVIGLAIAVVIGGKVNELVAATVKDLLMPIIGAFLPNGAWETWVVQLGPVRLAIGHWLGVALDFVIVAFFVFLVAKVLIGKDDPLKTEAVKEGGEKWDDVNKEEAG